jgi:protein O-mannosyl-transferase
MKKNKPPRQPAKQAAKAGSVADRPTAPRAEKRARAGTPAIPAWAQLLAGVVLAVAASFVVFAGSLRGPFLYDDVYLPFIARHLQHVSLKHWITGNRPFLMFTFWMNNQMSGLDTWSYHATNILLHALNSVLVFLILRWLIETLELSRSATRNLALFGAAIFLVHPLQAESVAYIASRSETLTVFFLFGSYTLFLYFRKQGLAWLPAVGVLLLFGLAQLTKEYAVALIGLLLLTDLMFPIHGQKQPASGLESIKRNWRLYLPLVLAGLAGVFFVFRTLSSARTAGFHIKEATPIEYLFTQFRSWWGYVRLFAFPFGLNIDHDLSFTRSLADPWAWAGLLFAALSVAAALRYRRRYPLAAFGCLAYFLLLAPTSSFIPIADPFVEHRMYLPIFGLILIVIELVRHARLETQMPLVLAGIVALLAVFTFQRSALWGDEVALWSDAVSGSPNKMRPQFQLAFAHYTAGQCAQAVSGFEKAAQLAPPTNELLADWGLALDCLGRPDEARAKFGEAAKKQPSAYIYSQIAMTYGKQNRLDDALRALDQAAALDPRFDPIYSYRGVVYYKQAEFAKSKASFERALHLNPGNEAARNGLALVNEHLSQLPH